MLQRASHEGKVMGAKGAGISRSSVIVLFHDLHNSFVDTMVSPSLSEGFSVLFSADPSLSPAENVAQYLSLGHGS